jgi:hypothetical protein
MNVVCTSMSIARNVPKPVLDVPKPAMNTISLSLKTEQIKNAIKKAALIGSGFVTGCNYISLSGVIGKSRTRLPVALYTALATAAAIPIKAISPIPLAPIWFM